MKASRCSDSPPAKSRFTSPPGLGVFSVLFLVSLVCQWLSGAWKSDFGAHADEASHVVTSLMVRDYVAGGFLEEAHPIRFAESYYEQFPKVAIGHYPPGFYVVAGVFTIPFRCPGAFLVLATILCAAAGWLTWLFGQKLQLSRLDSFLIALLFCLLPLTRTYTAVIMSDLLLVVFCLAAVLSFIRFLETNARSQAILFGVWAAFAILTKGSGLFLALVPIFAITVTGRWNLLSNFRLWLAPVPVLVLAAPWMLMTREITAEGMGDQSAGSFMLAAIPFYLKGIVYEFGWVVIAFLGVIVFACIPSKISKKLLGEKTAPFGVALACLISGILLLILVPAGMDHRYMLPIAPFVLLLTAKPICDLGASQWPNASVWIIPIFFLVVILDTSRPVQKQFSGASESISSLLHGKSPNSKEKIHVLVISSPNGEGALTAAAAFQGKSTLQIQRGSKLLGESDWLGREYKSAMKTPSDLVNILEREGIDYIILDPPLTTVHLVQDHWVLAHQFLDTDSEGLKCSLISTWKSHRKHNRDSRFSVYQFTMASP